jgi:hypothetical protein
MFPSEPLLSASELAKLFTARLAEHLPGTDTGDPEITDKRTSWNKACQAAVESLARSLEFRILSSRQRSGHRELPGSPPVNPRSGGEETGESGE